MDGETKCWWQGGCYLRGGEHSRRKRAFDQVSTSALVDTGGNFELSSQGKLERKREGHTKYGDALTCLSVSHNSNVLAFCLAVKTACENREKRSHATLQFQLWVQPRLLSASPRPGL